MEPILLEVRKVESVVLASITLHNFLRTKSGARAIYTPPGSLDHEDREAETILQGPWRNDNEPQGLTSLEKQPHGRLNRNAKEIRDELCKYFNSEDGSVPWQ